MLPNIGCSIRNNIFLEPNTFLRHPLYFQTILKCTPNVPQSCCVETKSENITAPAKSIKFRFIWSGTKRFKRKKCFLLRVWKLQPLLKLCHLLPNDRILHCALFSILRLQHIYHDFNVAESIKCGNIICPQKHNLQQCISSHNLNLTLTSTKKQYR